MADTYFADWEFANASPAGMTAVARERIRQWRAILDPAREWYGGKIIVTSYARASGSHDLDGVAIDIQPEYGTERDYEQLARWIAWRFLPTGELGKVLYERPTLLQRGGHIHLSLNPGASGGLWADFTGEEDYVQLTTPEGEPVRRSGLSAWAVLFVALLYGAFIWLFDRELVQA